MDIFIAPVGHCTTEPAYRILCGTDVGNQTVDTPRKGTGTALCIRGSLVGQSLQSVQLNPELIQKVFVIPQRNLRFQLPGNTAHILAAVHGSGVCTAVQIAGLPSYNTAHVVAHMFIANIACVFTALDHTAGKTGNTADIGSRRNTLRSPKQRNI